MYVCDANKPKAVEEVHAATQVIKFKVATSPTEVSKHVCVEKIHIIKVLTDIYDMFRGIDHLSIQPINK